MINIFKKYYEDKFLEQEYKEELDRLFPNIDQLESNQLQEMQSRFSNELSFGTGGIRGLMGAGINRMNLPIIRKVTSALGKTGIEFSKGPLIAVVGYDTRINSKKFAEHAACVLKDLGYKVWISPSPSPTPFLCFAMKSLKATCGIIITASHNPKNYNGLKAYDDQGGQIVGSWDRRTSELMSSFPLIMKSPESNMDHVDFIPKTIEEAFIDNACSFLPINYSALVFPKIMYTPFHGTGGDLVSKIFSKANIPLMASPSQSEMNGSFPTCPRPNPEEIESYQSVITDAIKLNARYILANDPDADRIGLVAEEIGYINTLGNSWKLMTGNDLAALTLDYLARTRSLNGFIITTIVTSDFLSAVARIHGLGVVKTLTGFKNIANSMNRLEDLGDRYVFSAEESYGMLIDDRIRDKDGVSSSVLIATMLSEIESKGITIWDAVSKLQETTGAFYNDLINIEDSTNAGIDRFNSLMNKFRSMDIDEFLDLPITHREDYSNGLKTYKDGTTTPLLDRKDELKSTAILKSNVLKFYLNDGSFVAFRPSGTEPKLKIYLQSCTSLDHLADLKKKIHAFIT